jgi:hypothetical protein
VSCGNLQRKWSFQRGTHEHHSRSSENNLVMSKTVRAFPLSVRRDGCCRTRWMRPEWPERTSTSPTRSSTSASPSAASAHTRDTAGHSHQSVPPMPGGGADPRRPGAHRVLGCGCGPIATRNDISGHAAARTGARARDSDRGAAGVGNRASIFGAAGDRRGPKGGVCWTGG